MCGDTAEIARVVGNQSYMVRNIIGIADILSGSVLSFAR